MDLYSFAMFLRIWMQEHYMKFRAWMSNHTHIKLWEIITYARSNINSGFAVNAIGIRVLMSNCVKQTVWDVIINLNVKATDSPLEFGISSNIFMEVSIIQHFSDLV